RRSNGRQRVQRRRAGCGAETGKTSPSPKAPLFGTAIFFPQIPATFRDYSLEIHDDLAEYLSAFQPGEATFKIIERHLGIDDRRDACGHFRKAVADVAHRRAE